MNEFGTEFNRGVREGAVSKNASTNTPARFQDGHCHARVVKIACGGETGCASADDEGSHDDTRVREKFVHLPA